MASTSSARCQALDFLILGSLASQKKVCLFYKVRIAMQDANIMQKSGPETSRKLRTTRAPKLLDFKFPTIATIDPKTKPIAKPIIA
jgi:hypothetical protein